ncbi:MAG: hypothetical protein ACK4Q5_03005 [Saprospiraceae bacterium]
MKNLEQFIQQNRAAFDAAEPPAQVWAGIECALTSTDVLEKFIAANRAAFNVAEPSAQVWANLEASGQLGDCSLESFLTENRTHLDTAVPDLRVWANIEKTLPATQPAMRVAHLNFGRQLMRAAAAIALIISCFGAGMWYARNGSGGEGMAMSEVSNEYAELENYYRRDISAKQEKLASFASQNDPVLDDLAQLDNMMAELKHELANVPEGNREQVIRAMIDNYKAKTAILEKVLEHIQHQNQEQSNSVKNEIKNI